MTHSKRCLPFLAAALCALTLAGCGSLGDTIGSTLGLGGSAAPENVLGVPATAQATATIRASYAGEAQAREQVIKMGYKSPQQALAAFNDLVRNRGGIVQAANFRAENRHGNGLDGGSLTLYVGNPANPSGMRWYVDVKVYADANLNTVIEGSYKVANTDRGRRGEGHDLMQDLRSRLGVSKFDDRLPPALLFKGDFGGF